MAVRRTAKVLLVDGNERLAGLLASLLNDEPGYLVVGVVDGADAAIRACRDMPPDVVVVDGFAVDGAGLQELRAVSGGAALLVWSRAGQLAGELATQVDGVLERGMTFRQVIDAVDAVLARQSHRADAGQA